MTCYEGRVGHGSDATTVGAVTTDGGGGSWVVVVVSSGDLRTRALGDRPVVIGRGAECDLQLDHHRVSRRHAELRVDGATCTIEDLGSRNGTIAAGRTLVAHERAVLAGGDPIGIGPFTLVVTRAPEQAARTSLVIDDPRGDVPVLRSVSRSATSVLIRGESGSGKQVLAETLHRLSGRPGELLSINCAALGHELLESELFGHERGAFTGAVATKPGLLEVAGEGTVLLDEIGDMPAALQAKLLRAVESREVTRVGGTRPIPIAARFLSATHRDLLVEVEAGRFRLDLYYRLAAITLSLSPLRDRTQQVLPIARELVAAAAARDRRSPPALSTAAVARLQGHTWPGNVRELRNVIDRALILATDSIEPQHVVFDEPRTAIVEALLSAGEEAERRKILDALEQCNGNQTRAAKVLGIARSTLATKLAIYRLPRPRK
jgi:two-component system, NtrC family, response regulator AtoC